MPSITQISPILTVILAPDLLFLAPSRLWCSPSIPVVIRNQDEQSNLPENSISNG